jgi:hypothetical protein
MRAKAAVVLALVIGAGLVGGCSDDGDRTTDADDPSAEAWCDAFEDIEVATVDPEDNVAFDRLVDVAPGEIREASEILRSFSLGDTSGDVTAADAEVRSYAGTHC